MARTPSRPGYLVAGGLVFLLLPIAFPLWDGTPIRTNWVVGGAVVSLLFFAMAYQSYQMLRNEQSSAPRS